MIVLKAKSPMPIKAPYCKEPDIKTIVVEAMLDIAMQKNMAEKTKHNVDAIHIAMLIFALSFGAFKSMKTKLRTPKTTARYISKTAQISNRIGVPKKSEDTRFEMLPQFNDNRVFIEKPSKVKFVSWDTNGKSTVYSARGSTNNISGTNVKTKRNILNFEPNNALLKLPVNFLKFSHAIAAFSASRLRRSSQL